MDDPLFLSLDHVLRLHAEQLECYGGSDGIRDIQLIESAIAQPQQGFGGEYLHNGLAEMAAAYLFHIAKNHGFVDGNKRTATDVALTFLELNGVDTNNIDDAEIESLAIAVAAGSLDKAAVTTFFRKYVKTG